jgi:H+-transporting ATPase
LRRADIGIAVQGSTDAARVAADIVLTRSDMTVILDAVAISRMIFERVRNYILFRINCTCVILFWSFLAGLALNFGFPALVLIIIAWLNNFIVLAVAYDHIVPLHEPLVWYYRDMLPAAFCVALLSCCEG